jgi:hypothetical protein
VTEKKNKSKPFQMTGGWLKNFMEHKEKLRIIMYYTSKDKATEGIIIDFEEIAEYFQGPHVIFCHIDISKNDIAPVLGYDVDQTTNIGKQLSILFVTEEDVKGKPIKDYKLIPYLVTFININQLGPIRRHSPTQRNHKTLHRRIQKRKPGRYASF